MWWSGSSIWRQKTPEQVKAFVDDPCGRFDYLCWDLYARVSSYYGDHPEAIEWRRNTLHAIEHGDGRRGGAGASVSDAIVEKHLQTMWRLNIVYDVLPRESEILHLKFWAAAFELLKERKAIYFETEGKNKGCWVMPSSAFREGSEDEEDDSKVIVRSNSTVTYVGKDIAYQLWKFGLLGKDFYYRPWHTYPGGHVVWASTDEPQADGSQVRRRDSGVQRDRLASVLLAGCGSGGAARARIFRAGRREHSLLL